jgi:hypothetical protein
VVPFLIAIPLTAAVVAVQVRLDLLAEHLTAAQVEMECLYLLQDLL